MKETMRYKRAQVAELLARNGVNPEDGRDILDLVEGLCFRWAESNAAACVLEELLKERMDPAELREKMSSEDALHRIHGKVLETMPEEWWEEEPGETGEPDAGEPGETGEPAAGVLDAGEPDAEEPDFTDGEGLYE